MDEHLIFPGTGEYEGWLRFECPPTYAREGKALLPTLNAIELYQVQHIDGAHPRVPTNSVAAQQAYIAIITSFIHKDYDLCSTLMDEFEEQIGCVHVMASIGFGLNQWLLDYIAENDMQYDTPEEVLQSLGMFMASSDNPFDK